MVAIKIGNCTICSFAACQQLPRDIATSNSKTNKYIMSMDHIHYTKSINLVGYFIGIKGNVCKIKNVESICPAGNVYFVV